MTQELYSSQRCRCARAVNTVNLKLLIFRCFIKLDVASVCAFSTLFDIAYTLPVVGWVGEKVPMSVVKVIADLLKLDVLVKMQPVKTGKSVSYVSRATKTGDRPSSLYHVLFNSLKNRRDEGKTDRQ